MSDTKNEIQETVWPEKMEAIYKQFPWLIKQIANKTGVKYAYVRKFDESTLELNKLSRRREPIFLSNPYDEHINLIWFVDDSGKITRKMGVRVEKVKRWWFCGKEIDKEVIGNDESVRQAVQNFSETDSSSYLVYILDDTLVVFKPPQKGLTIKQWYDTLKKEMAK
jgi:hypothetical protein